MQHFGVTVLLIIVAILGWFAGRQRYRQHWRRAPHETLPHDYFIGLNYLLNEQPDRAIDIFLELLTVDEYTVETHLSLGSLFRRRGEVERAIRLHQHVMSRPDLSKVLRMQALLELGRDYLAAGVLDRAERLFLEALETSGAHQTDALLLLRQIYEQEKDWLSALGIAQRLPNHVADKNSLIAHYYCELIELANKNFSDNTVKNYLEMALKADPNGIRPGLLQLEYLVETGAYSELIKVCKRLLKRDTHFLPLILPWLKRAYHVDRDDKVYLDTLLSLFMAHPHPQLLIAVADVMKEWKGLVMARQFVADAITQHPHLASIEYLLGLDIDMLPRELCEPLRQDQQFLHTQLEQNAYYQCESCGFNSKKLIWHCPSCARWATIKPKSI